MNRMLIALVVVAAFGAGIWYVYEDRREAEQMAAGPTVEAPPAVAPPAVTPPGAPIGATLLPGLGDYRFEVTSAHPDVQKWVDQGLALTYGFNHDAAERSFLRAAELDPSCAMCWWGAALVLGPHVNAPMDPGNNAKAWTRLQKAQELAPKASEREQAFIKALSARYAENPPTDRRALDEAYAAATGELVKARPDDLDAAVFYAEAQMDLHPWDYYDTKRNEKDHTAEFIATLESVMKRNPDHAGALHLYIHAVEASKNPDRGAVAADRLANLLPGSGHLVHMPAHIYARVGRYHDAVVANQKAVAADDSYLAACKPGVAVYPLAYVPHNHHFLWWASSMEGSAAAAIAAADETAKRATVPELLKLPDFVFLTDFMSTPIKARAQLGRWDEVVAMPKPELPYPIAVWNYAQGMAAIRQGRLDAADQHLAEVAKAAADPAWQKAFIGPQHPLSGALKVAEGMLAGELAAARKDYKAAIAALEQAVVAEDAIVYYEPPVWHQPVRPTLGAVQIAAGDAAAAEATYRKDLEQNRESGWSLFGLGQALRAQKKDKEAKEVEARFAKAWTHADVKLESSRL